VTGLLTVTNSLRYTCLPNTIRACVTGCHEFIVKLNVTERTHSLKSRIHQCIYFPSQKSVSSGFIESTSSCTGALTFERTHSMNSSKQHILTIHQKAFVWHPLGDIEAIFFLLPFPLFFFFFFGLFPAGHIEARLFFLCPFSMFCLWFLAHWRLRGDTLY